MSEITASRPEVVNGDIICATSVSHILAVQKSTPVSYTHLDVYKRQLRKPGMHSGKWQKRII